MSGEEKARESIEGYEKLTNEVVLKLKSAHLQEYNNFKMNLELFREKFVAECELTRQALVVTVQKETVGPSLDRVKRELAERHDEQMSAVQRLRARMASVC